MKIRPLYDRIVVKRIEEKQQMQGGLYIPDSAKEKPQEGEVVAVKQRASVWKTEVWFRWMFRLATGFLFVATSIPAATSNWTAMST